MNTASGGRPIPVWVVTGFLGAGKTSLLNSLLTGPHGMRLAVLVNEFGELGIDGALIDGRATSVVEVANGCICCSSHGDLGRGLTQLLSMSDEIDGLIIETSGLAQPLGVVDVLYSEAFCDRVQLAAILTVVDAANFDANLDNAVVAFQQLMAADLLILNKIDLVPTETAELIKCKLGQLNRSAGILPTNHGEVPADVFTHDDMCLATVRSPAPADCVHPTEVGSMSCELPGAIDRVSFAAWVAGLPPNVWRVKALVRFDNSGEWFIIQRVGLRENVTQVHSTEKRSTVKVVLIGRELDEAAISAGLYRCLRPERQLHATLS